MRQLTTIGRAVIGGAALAVAIGLAGLPAVFAASAADAVVLDLSDPSWADIPQGMVVEAEISDSPGGAWYAIMGGPITLTGHAPADVGVQIATSEPVTLDDLTIDQATGETVFSIGSGQTANLVLEGTTTLDGHGTNAGLGVAQGGTANITGTGTLIATGEEQAAAIGGSGRASFDSKTGAPANADQASCGTVSIGAGAHVTATSSGSGAALGGGAYGAGCQLTPAAGSVVTATATGSGTAIGGGAGLDGVVTDGYTQSSPGGAGGTMIVAGGTVTATAASSPAIGGGRTGDNTGAGDNGANVAGTAGTLMVTSGSLKMVGGDASDATGAKPGAAAVPDGVVPVRPIPADGVTAVTVDGVDWGIAANHPGDTNIHLYLTNADHTVDVTGASGTITYDVAHSSSQAPSMLQWTVHGAASPTPTPTPTPSSPTQAPTSAAPTEATTSAAPTPTETPTSAAPTPTTEPATPTGAPTSSTPAPAPSGSTSVASPSGTIHETIPAPPAVVQPGPPETIIGTVVAPGANAVVAPRVASHRPAIAGTAKVGRTVKARTYRAAWTTGSKLTVKWYVGGKKAATASKVKLKKGQKGKRLLVKVTGSKAGYRSVTRASKAKKIR